MDDEILAEKSCIEDSTVRKTAQQSKARKRRRERNQDAPSEPTKDNLQSDLPYVTDLLLAENLDKNERDELEKENFRLAVQLEEDFRIALQIQEEENNQPTSEEVEKSEYQPITDDSQCNSSYVTDLLLAENIEENERQLLEENDHRVALQLEEDFRVALQILEEENRQNVPKPISSTAVAMPPLTQRPPHPHPGPLQTPYYSVPILVRTPLQNPVYLPTQLPAQHLIRVPVQPQVRHPFQYSLQQPPQWQNPPTTTKSSSRDTVPTPASEADGQARTGLQPCQRQNPSSAVTASSRDTIPVPTPGSEADLRARAEQLNSMIDSNDYEGLLVSLDPQDDVGHRGLHPDEIDSLPLNVHPEESEHKNCSICMENFQTGEITRYIPCVHYFHAQCIDRWMQENAVCPVCNKDIRLE